MLTTLQKLALSNIGPSKDERAAIKPGNYSVDFTVTVRGTLGVNKPETFTPTVHVPLIPTVALALKKMGVQREGFLALLRESMTEVLEADTTMRKAIVDELGLGQFEADFRATLGSLPRQTRAGKVTAAIVADIAGDV